MKELIIFGVICVVSSFFAFWMADYSCEQRWNDSGIPSRWSVYTECQIKVDGKWIPETVYREIQQ